jgi:glycosyltransferase involved in cell wall biosynthesis
VITVLQTSSHSIANSIARPSQAEWLKELVSSSQFVVAVSDDVVSSIYELQRSTGSNVNVVLIENGARLGVQDPGRRGRSTISFIGRPHVQKGFHFFERLASDFGQYGVQFNANTVSVPAERTCPGINYSYQLSDAELLSFYEQTDLLVVPYTHADGMPLAILEAINCGVPVLGFDSPGIAGLLRRYGQTLIEPSYQCLSDAVRGWISGQRSFPQPNAGAVPSWDAQVRQYVELIKRTEIRSSSGGVR